MNLSLMNSMMNIVLMIPGILLGFTVHEYAHALVAHKLGDPTPRMQGRLTLNPIKHIDLFGFILILIAGFGWAKPVQTNPRNFKNGYKDDIKVSIAGIVANLLFAGFLGLVYRIFMGYSNATFVSSDAGLRLFVIIAMIVQYAVQINCMLAVFNILPLPGLDGFHVLRDLAPSAFYRLSSAIYQYQLIIMLVLILPIIGGRSIISIIIGPVVNILVKLFI